jgi:hypothetical protein
MFLLDSFHMYNVIGTAVVTGIISIFLIKKFNIKTIAIEKVKIQVKTFNKGQKYGGLTFGMGLAITGAYRGPIYAQLRSAYFAIIVTLLSTIFGDWLFGKFRDKLPMR